MKHSSYKSLDICMHDPKIDEKLEYKNRIESSNTVILPFDINGYPAFFVRIPEMTDLIYEILLANAEIAKLAASTPNISPLLYSCLLDEIQMSNEIEGIHSSKKELAKVDLNQASNKDLRFASQIQQYRKLLDDSIHFPHTAKEVAEAYEQIFLQDPPGIEKELFPDGVWFRKGDVIVGNGIRIFHTGVQSEEKIIEVLDQSLQAIQNEKAILQAALFHFIFGYVHPFYDGNGRLNRFLCSVKLADELELAGILKFSLVLRNNRKTYYRMFEQAEVPMNKGELTPFILSFLQLLYQSFKEGIEFLQYVNNQYAFYLKGIEDTPNLSKTEKSFLQHMAYLEVFCILGQPQSEIAETIQCSKPMVQKMVKKFDHLLYKEKMGRTFIYRLNRNAFLVKS